jgi:BMFP domain-containing protein YqiC
VSWIKNAFAIEADAAPTPAQREVVEKVCREVVRRGLTTPALVSLEVFRPMNYIGAQAMHFLRPIATLILDGEGYRHLSEFLENRESVDYLRRRIEELEDEHDTSKGKKLQADHGKSQDPAR